MANHFISTDESLELFQARMREKYSKITSERKSQFASFGAVDKDRVQNVNNSSHVKKVSNNSQDNLVNEGSILNDSKKKSVSKIKTKEKKLFKNSDAVMKYYDMLDS